MKIGLVVILVLYSFLGYSQEIVYKQFTSENGLLSSTATQVLLDKDGYIWVATNNGVVRFDGYNFENYNITNQLPENDIVGMYKSEDHVLWFLSRSGLLSFFKEGQIKSYKFNNKITALLHDYDFIEPKSVLISEEYIEFNVFEQARFRIDKQGNIDEIYNVKKQENVIDLRNQKLRYFISSQNSRLKIINSNNQLNLINLPTVSCGDPVLCSRRGDTIYLASQNTLYVIIKGDIKSYFYDNAIISLQLDTEDDLWVGFKSGGVFCFANGEVKNQPDNHELKGNSISSVIRDKQKSLWISSLNGGVFYLPSQLFKQVTTKEGLLDNNITRLDFSNDYLWAITGNKTVARLNYNSLKNYEITNEDFSSITDIYWYNNRLWVSFKNKMSFFKGEKLIDIFRLDEDYGNHSRINRINHGIGNNLWLSKSDGFALLRNKKIVFESSVQNYQNLNVNGIVEEPNGSLWLACKNGLWKFEDNRLFNYNKNNSILSNNIIDIVKDDKIGALWLAINGLGVVKILNDSVWTYTPKEGLISNSVSSIYAQGNYLWIGTKDGISRIDIRKSIAKSIVNITKKDGLVSNEINDIVANQDYVFAATNKGICFFNHTQYIPNTYVPKVIINSIVVGEQKIKQDTLIVVDYSSNNIKINYKSIHFKSRGDIAYRFRIKELNPLWIYTHSLSANYPFLPSGVYTFQVEASNENGIWTHEPTELRIKVGKPFWLEWWFFTLVAIVFVTMFYMLYRLFAWMRHRKEKIEREINEYRQMALTRQMNPHFIFNSLNAIQHYILQNDARLSSRFLTKFSKLIRLSLENSQSSLINLEKEMIALNLYLELEALRFKDKMQYAIEIDKRIDVLSTMIPPMLIQPFVENAVWHGIMNKEDGTTGLLEINFKLQQEDIICVIKDNGIGRKKSLEINQKKYRTHNSMGTLITQDRIELINSIFKKKIRVEYDDPEDIQGKSLGTIVKIIFSTKT